MLDITSPNPVYVYSRGILEHTVSVHLASKGINPVMLPREVWVEAYLQVRQLLKSAGVLASYNDSACPADVGPNYTGLEGR